MNLREKVFTLILMTLISLSVQAQEKPRLAILPISGGTGGDGETIAERFSLEPDISSAFILVPQASISDAINANPHFQWGGITNTDILSSLGRQLNADFVAAGHIQNLGDRYLILITVINVETQEQVMGDYREYQTVEEIQGLIPDMAKRLIAAVWQESDPEDFIVQDRVLVKYIGSGGNVIIPASLEITEIGKEAFYKCESLTGITIPGSVTAIHAWAFDGCNNLTGISVDRNNKGYTGVNGILFNRGLNILFRYPPGKKNRTYTIPHNVVFIGDSAFDSCIRLTEIIIPEHITAIGEFAFNNCKNLTRISVDPNNIAYTDVDGILFNKELTTLVRYPSARTNTTYTIPESVTTIGGWAFYGSNSLTAIIIPNSITTILEGAFAECNGLKTVWLPRDTLFGIFSFDFGSGVQLEYTD